MPHLGNIDSQFLVYYSFYARCSDKLQSLAPAVQTITFRACYATFPVSNHLHFPLYSTYKDIFTPRQLFLKNCSFAEHIPVYVFP